MLSESTLSLLHVHVAKIMSALLFFPWGLRGLMSFAVEGVAFDSHLVCTPATSIKQSYMYGQ